VIVSQHLPFVFEGELTFAAVPAASSADVTVSVSPLFNKDAFTHLILPDLQDGLAFCNVHASENGTLKVRFVNSTAGDLTPTGTNAKLIQI
jgi:hypothetical protein